MIMRRARWAVLGAGMLLAACPGCGTVKTSGTSRTGTEQLLLTNAWDSALQKVDFRALTGVPVYLDDTNVSAVDKGWVVSSIRQAMLSQGVLLRAKPEQAQWIVEARVGAYGTDNYSWLLGMPQTSVPQTITGMPTGTIPELALVKKNDQQGIAKLALFGYDRASGQLVWNSGTMVASATAKDVYVGGVGPIQSGTIHGGTKVVGIRVPLSAESVNPNDPTGAPTAPPFSDAAIKIAPSATDAGSFAP